jgi:ketosteroid isomerase-like protein
MQAEAVVRELYTAFRAKDEVRLRELIAKDVEWNQCEGFPGGRSRRGVDDVLAGILGTNHSLWSEFRAETTEFLAAGSTVVVLGAYSGRHAKTGKAMRAVFTHVYRVHGGCVTRFDQVTDTAPMVAAMS